VIYGFLIKIFVQNQTMGRQELESAYNSLKSPILFGYRTFVGNGCCELRVERWTERRDRLNQQTKTTSTIVILVLKTFDSKNKANITTPTKKTLNFIHTLKLSPQKLSKNGFSVSFGSDNPPSAHDRNDKGRNHEYPQTYNLK
jgi:hypothetical protein